MNNHIHQGRTSIVCLTMFMGLVWGWGPGCGSNSPKGDTGPDKPVGDGTTPDKNNGPDDNGAPAEKPAIQARGEGSSEADAYADALAGLESQLYGSDAWAQVLDLEIHDRQGDPFEATSDAGLTRVTIGLGRERVAEILGALEDSPWSPSAPAPLAEVISKAATTHVAALACQRRQVLLKETCEAPEVNEADDALQALAGTIRLRSYYTGGVPVTSDNRPLRPIVVVAEHRSGGSLWQPLPGLPVVLRPGNQPDALDAFSSPADGVTDQNGQVRFEFSDRASWPAGVQVEVDRGSLLGPLAGTWSVKNVALAGREIAVGRWSLVATEKVQGKATNQRVFTTNARRVLGRSTVLSNALADELASASPEALAGRLPAMADEQAGRIDVLFVADVDSDYAGRLSTSRVWYEARASVRVYNAWTGKLITTEEHSLKESGVGDSRADQAARTKLAEEMAGKLLQVSP